MAENAYRKLTQDEIEYERMESEIRSRLYINTEISIARKEGEEKGRQEGRQEGEKKLNRLNQLNLLLIGENRIEDLQRAAEDETYRQTLYLEFGL